MVWKLSLILHSVGTIQHQVCLIVHVPTNPVIDIKASSTIEEPVIKELAAKYNKTPGQIILNWHLSRGYVVIPKTVTVSRIKENFESTTFEMTQEELKKISGLNKNARVYDAKDYEAFGNIPIFA